MVFLLAFLSLLPTHHTPSRSAAKVTLTVNVQNVRTQKGAVYFALFRKNDDFPTGKPSEGKKVNATGSQVHITFSVEPGTYAVAIFHDENGNGQMDKKIFGIPKEPYGFSNNFRPRMSAPKFKDCEFTVGSAAKTIGIKLD